MKRYSTKISKFILVSILITAWIFTGFPPIWHNPRIPPKIQEAFAAPVADFNIQRRCETPAAGTGTVTLTAGTDYTAPADNTKAFIRLISTRLSGMGDTVGGGTQEADDFTWYISDPDFAGGSVTFTRAGTTNPQRFCWEIIEYVGSSGGANEMKVLDVGTVTYGTTDTTIDGASVTPTDDNDVVVFITGQNSVETTDQDEVNAGYSTSEWVAASDIPRFTRGFTGDDANSISYAVVEFTGSNWGVERIEHTFTADATTETETITDVGDISRAFFHAQFRLDLEEGLDDSWAEMWISSTNQASFRTQAASGALPSQEHAVIWIVRNSDTASETKMNVQHISGTRTSSGVSEGPNNEEDEWTDTITAVGDTAQTSIMGENGRSSGNGTAYPRGNISLYLNSTTGVKLYQSDDGQPQTYRFQVVEWPKTNPTFTQSAYRFFNNNDSTDVGTALAAQDTVATLGSAGAAFRLRILMHISDAQLGASGENFKLQFAEQSGTCDTGFVGETYADVTAATVIAYNNNPTPADDATLTANANDPTHGADTIVNQTYEELNNFTNSVAAIPAGQDGKWDFSLKDNGAPAGTTYCFRIVKSDASQLDTYTVIPEITTADSSPIYSVSITSSGVVEYGFVALSTASSTVGNGYTQTVQNDGNTTEKLNIKSSNATGGTTWTLAGSIGPDQFTHEFSTTTGSTWTAMTTADTYVTAAPSVAQSGTVNFDFRLTTPSASSDYQQKSITITIQAVAP